MTTVSVICFLNIVTLLEITNHYMYITSVVYCRYGGTQ